jgi:hypothetical protein
MYYDFLSNSLPYLVLTAVTWLTYFYSVKTSFVIDDIDSYSSYDGKLQGYYYGAVVKWLRYHICGGNFPSKIKYSDGKFAPQGRIPFGHHILSIVIFNLAILAAYPALSVLLGERLALLTLLLFVVHPISTQAVAWISGIGYSLAFLWLGLTLDLILYVKPNSLETSILVFVLFIILQYLMVNALMATATFCIILLFLGYPSYALISAVISLCLGINVIRKTHAERKKTFDSQNMGNSAKFNLRKLVTMVQTIGYYSYLTLMPYKMGLYHVWGYHYNKELERFNFRFLIGLFVCFVLLTLLIFGPFPVQLAVLIYICIFAPFSNFITVQQFVAERYIFLPSLGTCILLSYYLGNTWAYPLLFGLYLMKTWQHLPSYDNEIKFYQSNIWNFPKSEVAYGNLGCVWLRIGKTGTAMDCWHTSREINPDYDVPNYNIFSSYKATALARLANGDLMGAVEILKTGEPFLKQCISSSICHFQEGWKKEHYEIEQWINNPLLLLRVERARLDEIKKDLGSKPITPQIQGSLEEIERKLAQITSVEDSQKCPPPLSQDQTASLQATSENSTPKPTA